MAEPQQSLGPESVEYTTMARDMGKGAAIGWCLAGWGFAWYSWHLLWLPAILIFMPGIFIAPIFAAVFHIPAWHIAQRIRADWANERKKHWGLIA